MVRKRKEIAVKSNFRGHKSHHTFRLLLFVRKRNNNNKKNRKKEHSPKSHTDKQTNKSMDLSKPISLDEADAALTTLHDSMALLKCFVAQQERKVLQKTNQLPMSSAPIHLHRELVFDAVLQWIRTVLDDATNGELFPLFPGCPPDEDGEDEAMGQDEGAALSRRRPTSSSSQGGGSAAAAAMMFNGGGGAGVATASTNNNTTAGSNNSRPPTASRVPSAATTTAVGVTPHVEPTRVSSSSSQHPHRPHHANRSIAHLATLTHLLTQQLEAERRNKHFYVSASTSFNRILEGYREENAAIAAYKDRIVELQAVLNDTKKVGEVGALVGPPTNTAPKHAVASSGGGSAAAAAAVSSSPLVVPVDCIPSDEQKRREVANALAAVTIHMKDKWERTNAECSVLLSEKAYLMTESRLLLDRVKVLEAQLSVVTASASACLRELQKARSQEAQRSQQLYRAQNSHIAPSPHILQERLSAVTTTASTSSLLPAASRVESSTVVTADGGPTCVIGGVTMEVSVALWLRDVYVSLMANPDAAGVLQLLRHPNHNSSSVQAAAATPTTGSMSGPPTRQGSAAAERGGGGAGVPSASSSAPPRPGSGAAAAGVPLGASTSSRGGSAGGRGGSLTMIEATTTGSEGAADGGDLGPTTTPTSGAVGRPSSSSSFVDHVRQVRASRGSSADTERTSAD